VPLLTVPSFQKFDKFLPQHIVIGRTTLTMKIMVVTEIGAAFVDWDLEEIRAVL
jgi:hypothetical protein